MQNSKMRQTSLDAYKALLDIGERQRIVFTTIRHHPNLTALEITGKLKKFDPNFVRPRINELVKIGLVCESGKRCCSISGRMVLTWISTI